MSSAGGRDEDLKQGSPELDDDDVDAASVISASPVVSPVAVAAAATTLRSVPLLDQKARDCVARVKEELKNFKAGKPHEFMCSPVNPYRLILTEPEARATAIFRAIGPDLSRWNIETLRRLLVDGFNVYLPPGYLQSHFGVLNHIKKLYSQLESETRAYSEEIREENTKLQYYHDMNIKSEEQKQREALVDQTIANKNAAIEASYNAAMKAYRAEKKRIGEELKRIGNPGELARFVIPDPPVKPKKEPNRNKRRTVYQYEIPQVRGEYIPTQEFARRRHPRRLLTTAFSGLSLLAILTALYKIK